MPISPAYSRDAYHIEGKTDLQVTREQAIARQKGGSKFGRIPEGTLIHFHDESVKRIDCNKYKHELYKVGYEEGGVEIIEASDLVPTKEDN